MKVIELNFLIIFPRVSIGLLRVYHYIMHKIFSLCGVLFAVAFCVLVASCEVSHKYECKKYLSGGYPVFPYNLDYPEKVHYLSISLEEVSALSYWRDNSLMCVNDERGIVYEYNLDMNKITQRYRFGKSGDYEGVEVVGEDIYVLSSGGKIYKIMVSDKSESPVRVQTYSTPLSSRNNCEGLGYDRRTKSLLIALKGKAFLRKGKKGFRGVWGFSLINLKLDSLPRYVISLAKVREAMYSWENKSEITLEKKRSESGKRSINFRPSSISVHPLTGNIYLLGSVGKLLLILNHSGDLLGVVALDPILFKQPEGLCFSPNGTLYISNEGRGGKANILEFSYKR